MQKIQLQKIVPAIFAEEPLAVSGNVWLHDVQFEKGKKYLVEASSGKGKSSLFSYLTGYREDYQGAIFFDDVNLKNLSLSQWSTIRKQHVSILFQDLKLFSELTSLENITIKNRLTQHLSMQTIKQLFEQLGIADKMHTKVEKMSFGQRQRLALIRALAQPFDFILLDEPISHLDSDNAHIMSNLIASTVQQNGAGVIVSSIGQHLPMVYDEVFAL